MSVVKCFVPQNSHPVVAVVGTFVVSSGGYHALYVDTPQVVFRRVLRVPHCPLEHDRDIVPVFDHNMSHMTLSKRSQRAIGPILSLYEWLSRASSIWPNAHFIAKADEDAIVVDPHLFGRMLESLPPHSLWGRMERGEFDTTRMTPHRFFSRRECSPENDKFGFEFPKGFLFALSRTVAKDVLRSASFITRRVLDVWSTDRPKQLLPYEDIVVGFTAKRNSTQDLHVIDARLLLGEGIWKGYTGLFPCSIAVHIRQSNMRYEHMRRMLAWKHSNPCRNVADAPIVQVGTWPSCMPNVSVKLWRYSHSDPKDSMALSDQVRR